MLSHPRWWLAPVAILAASGLAVAAILFAPVGRRDARPGAGAWDSACPGELAADFTCFRQHYQSLVHDDGVAAAFADLKAAYAESDFVRGNCHQLVHVIGQTAGAHFGDVATAYDQGDDFCWSGYYHGVMQAVIAKIGFTNLSSRLGTICAGVSAASKYSFAHYNCAHGVGHGVLAVNNGELFQALGTCDTLTDSWERQSCYGGVFMENVMVEANPDHGSSRKYFRADDPMYPCTAVARDYKTQCFLMQTSHALHATGYDFGRVFGLCDGVEDDFRPTCYQSLGRDASGSTVSDAVRTRDICMLGRDLEARGNCLAGAVRDFISYHHSNAAGVQLCGVVDAALRESCLTVARTYSVE